MLILSMSCIHVDCKHEVVKKLQFHTCFQWLKFSLEQTFVYCLIPCMHWQQCIPFPRSPAHVSRRLAFQAPRFYSRTPTDSPRPDTVMYIPDTPKHERYWRPGQTLPTTSAASTLSQSPDYGRPDLHSKIQQMHSSIESNFKDLKCHITELQGRVASIEDRQKQLELQHSAPHTSSTSSSESSEKGRKRRSPPDLHVLVNYS